MEIAESKRDSESQERGNIQTNVENSLEIYTAIKKTGELDANGQMEEPIVVTLNLLQICAELWKDKPLYLMNKDPEQLDYAKRTLSQFVKNEKLIDAEVILNINLYEIFNHLYINDIRTIFDIKAFQKTSNKNQMEDLKIIEYCQTQTTPEKTDFSKKIVPAPLKSIGGSEIYWTCDCFVELQVTKLPWGYKVDVPEGEFGNQKVHMIIGPVSALQRDRQILKQITDGKEEPFEEIKRFVLSSESFKFLINWVFKHHVSEERYSKEIIRKKYVEFLEWWYEAYYVNDTQEDNPENRS